MTTVFTVGHGARSLEDFVAILTDANVVRLIDVRRFPGSRRHPHFGRAPLTIALPDAGIDYEFQGEALGGRRQADSRSRHRALRNKSFRGYADFMDTETFRAAIKDLEAAAAAGPAAVMCAETLWWRCHRRHIADVLVLHGFEVTHLIELGKSQPHKIHPALRTDDEDHPVYDVEEPKR